MAKRPKPSTAWKEVVADDEAERFAAYAAQFAELQKRKSHRFGTGRALHRKQLLALKASLVVLPNLPAHARHGLFARAGRHDAWVRLSNGGTDRAPDRRPDVRGFSIKVLEVKGPGALGHGDTWAQDFTLINQEVFAFPKSDEFVALVVAASRGGAALLRHMLRRYGFGALGRIRKMAATFKKPFKGFANEAVYSAAPIACGPYAVRVRLRPVNPGAPLPGASADWAADLRAHLAERVLGYELQLQFFVDEQRTPIEDASVNWSEEVAPYLTVARLSIAQQEFDSEAALLFAAQVEAAKFDPWEALAEHRPLGDVMRARKVVYFESQKGRGTV